MCWIERLENVHMQIADKDIEVYKIVYEANKQSCKSCVQGFIYKINTIYKIPSIQIRRTSIFNSIIFCVEEAYHSYTKIQYTFSRISKKDSIYKVKGIIFGNQIVPLSFNNPYYAATFVIPKGSQYAVNEQGEIISNQIMYTGKYLKL